jgi:hypothetical protein
MRRTCVRACGGCRAAQHVGGRSAKPEEYELVPSTVGPLPATPPAVATILSGACVRRVCAVSPWVLSVLMQCPVGGVGLDCVPRYAGGVFTGVRLYLLFLSEQLCVYDVTLDPSRTAVPAVSVDELVW